VEGKGWKGGWPGEAVIRRRERWKEGGGGLGAEGGREAGLGAVHRKREEMKLAWERCTERGRR